MLQGITRVSNRICNRTRYNLFKRRSAEFSKCQDVEDNYFFEDIKKQIEENRKIIRRHSFSHSHLRARGLNTSNSNLKIAMNNAMMKMAEPPNSIANIPSYVTIEILSNGTTQLRPCVVMRTPLKVYMFNCPEGASRFLPQLRLKALNVNDIFITRPVWDNIAGISSILLSKESNALPTRIHGTVNIKHFLECIRPFQDSDYGSDKYPSQVEERAYDEHLYEDAGLKVYYLPLTPLLGEETCKNSMEIAYYVELKAPARRIDPTKLMAMKIPKGPWIGKLKNGEEVTLQDGRKVVPDDVYANTGPNEDRTRMLLVDCSSKDHIRSLLDNSIFNKECSRLNYLVHLSKTNLLNSEIYKSVIARVGETCQHIVANEDCAAIPGIESIYRNHRILNEIAPSLFPPLFPTFSGLVSQGADLQKENGNMKLVAPLQKFWMREGGGEEPILIDLRDSELDLSEEAKSLIKKFREDENSIESSCPYPKLSFLGTSSAVPSKYRNVSSYLIETSPDAAILLDSGEGAYGQLLALFGPNECDKLLTRLHAVLITHAHQDHMNGLYTIIEKRRDCFEKLGLEYVPLVLVANRNVLKPLKTYSMCFDNLMKYVSIVDISRHPVTPPASPGAPPNKRRRLPSPTLSASRNVIEMLPNDLYSPDKWNIQELKAVQVHHTRMANGYVLGIGGKRVVFSGDTKPCDLLVEEGMNADVLVHEATFEDGHEKDALRKKHSTMGQAVKIGQNMKAKHIILTHFSARYPKVPALPSYLDEYGNIGVAMDNLSVRFDHLPLLPKLIPIYREIYQQELFEIELRKEQRNLKTKDDENENASNHQKHRKRQPAVV